MSHISGLTAALITLLSGLAILAVLYIGTGSVDRGSFGGPGLALVVLAVMASFEAVAPLPVAFQYLGRTRESGRRIMEVVSTKSPVVFPGETAADPLQFSIHFENVSFRYLDSHPPVLDQINLQIAPGERVAVLGETGCGKTTLINLLARFWEPDSGRILIGGQGVENYREDDLRRFISIVSQQAHIFSTSLRKNLLLTRPEASDQDLRQALSAVQMLDFVDDLPDGLDTWVGEGGRLLSGGQTKRLAVARAFLHDGPIWILDEPTEGLDRTTEMQVLESILDHARDKTVIIITHRPLGLEKMDRIVWIEDGSILAQGDHNSLLMGNARYADLYPPYRPK